MATGREILILHTYFCFACEMRVRWLKDTPPLAQPISGGKVPEAAILQTLHQRMWLATLYSVVEGWNDLRLNKAGDWEGLKNRECLSRCQAQINALLSSQTGAKVKVKKTEVDETFEILLRNARHKVFHFEPSYLPGAIRRFHMEAERRRWPQQLHDWLQQFFRAWFQSQP